MTTLCIIQETDGGRGMSIVKLRDRQLLEQAAALAIAEALIRANAEPDPTLALIHVEEAERLRRTLTALVPELRAISTYMTPLQ
jgi:hypothetical protein